MVARLVEFGGVQVQEEGVDVVFGEDAPPPLAPPGFLLYHNGNLVTVKFSPHQLTAISLGIAAYDGQIGMGTMIMPGTPAWVAGDRITFTDLDGLLLYTGFVGDWSVGINAASPSEAETTYQLMDFNRQLIGRKLVDWTAGVNPLVVKAGIATLPSVTFIQQFLLEIMPDMTIDETYFDLTAPVDMPLKFYTGDGFMDLGGDLIIYTGKTFFMVPSQIENVPEFHFHELTPGPIAAGISVSDDPLDWDSLTIFPLTNPTRSMSASDLKNVVEGRNGTATVLGDNAGSIAVHNVGGLKWEAVISYSVDEQDLVVLVNGLLASVTGAGEERATYTFTIQHLRGPQLLAVPAGSTIGITSEIIDIGSARIAHETLTVSQDAAGNPLPGFWDLALELGYPFRHPAAIRGYGGQGGDSGALAAEFAIADHIDVVQPDILPPVGDSMIVTGYLRSEFGAIVNNGDVEVFWTLEQWQDEAGTIPATAWSLDDSSTLTDRFGKAVVILSHDDSSAWSWIKVHASL